MVRNVFVSVRSNEAVSISITFSSCINPPHVLVDVTNLSLDITGSQSMVLSTVILPIFESLKVVFCQSVGIFVSFHLLSLGGTFGFEMDCFFAGIRQISFDMGPVLNCSVAAAAVVDSM